MPLPLERGALTNVCQVALIVYYWKTNRDYANEESGKILPVRNNLGVMLLFRGNLPGLCWITFVTRIFRKSTSPYIQN